MCGTILWFGNCKRFQGAMAEFGRLGKFVILNPFESLPNSQFHLPRSITGHIILWV